VSLRAYLVLLRPPGTGRLVATALLGRLPLGIFSLATVLVVRHETGSFAAAGLASAALALGAGIVAPLQGRLVDRLGQPVVLLPCAIVNAAALGGLVLAARHDAPLALLAALAAIGGAAVPPLSACMRSQWAELFAHDEASRASAYSFESVLTELIYIVGPALVSVIVALASSDIALLLAATLSLAGTVGFATTRRAREWRGAAAATHTRAGALAAPGMRTLLLAIVPTGVVFGALEVAMPAFAIDHGRRAALAGLLLSGMALGSVLGGVWSGARNWTHRAPVRFLMLQAAFTVGLLPLLLVDSIAAMAVAMVLAGVALAPSAAAGNLLIDEMTPPGTGTEAFTWAVTATVVGTAIGTGVGGVLVQHAGARWALALACAGPALGTAIAVVRRRTLLQQPELVAERAGA
jgi:MFS family permease